MKVEQELAGFFEIIYHEKKLEMEIAYFGLFEEYIGKKLGGYMLTKAIERSFEYKVDRVWVHTCSLDHTNALSNYLARGMKVFNSEILNRCSA